MKVLAVLSFASTLLCLPSTVSSNLHALPTFPKGASVPAPVATAAAYSNVATFSLRGGATRRSLQVLPSPYDGVCYVGRYYEKDGEFFIRHSPTNCTTAFLSQFRRRPLCADTPSEAYQFGSSYMNFTYFPTTNLTDCEYKYLIS